MDLFDGLDAMGIIIIAVVALGFLLFVLLVVARLYRRATKEISFVRTGFGGQKVIVNGGALVFPVLHEIIRVNMNTLKLDVQRAREQALITRDRMRVDVQAEFYVRVQPTEESIANAAQTLGMKTMEPELLKELVEGKFVDALRSVAAEMGMEELHEQRALFVQKVQQVVSEDILKNGLELESVSLTGLDQTGKEYFNPNNAFDAEGLTKLTEAIELRRKKRNEIEQDTEVLVQRKNLEAAQQRLTISRDEEYAKLEQQREIEIRRAAQVAEIAREQADKQKEAESAQISAQQQVDQAKIQAQRIVEEQRIAMEQQLKEREIEKQKNVETANVLQEKEVELTEQDKAIAIAEKSKAQSEAQAAADAARAQAVKAAEQVDTVREVERAERQKRIELVEASKEAEREQISITIAAQAEKEAAEQKAEAIRTLANANADQRRIEADADAAAEKARADAADARYKVDAEGQRKLNEAANLLSVDQITMQLRMALIKHLPDIIRESVKPMESIDGIKIIQVDGLNAGAAAASAGGAGGGDGEGGKAGGNGNLAEQVVNSALRYRAQAPLLDSLMRDIGIDGGDLNGLVAGADDDWRKRKLDEINKKRDGKKD
ncbi:MAG: flotillin family protein [Rhodanobacteraceae bacterium]|nr:flotillin family protein [Xanthomonadales bacterium]MCP5479299.1 flotillin family protein [Rhodanobacteraceae bacterium]HPF74569.1 flotillin domain-containing protein [Xanthomonadaceae bacterium]HRX98878.1 flotillin domain-containing protein [Xanthomonadaceae bacterium]